eukprot:SAG22_NODE_745_length_7499_cov_2.796622_1_plen_157_part_00
MKIHLRGKKVRTNRILKSVSRRAAIRYQPRDATIVADKAFKITFGFQEKAKEHLYGIMLYHHNRLIKPYFRVGVQLQPNKDGLGVLGIMEADFLQPVRARTTDASRGHPDPVHPLSTVGSPCLLRLGPTTPHRRTTSRTLTTPSSGGTCSPACPRS